MFSPFHKKHNGYAFTPSLPLKMGTYFQSLLTNKMGMLSLSHNQSKWVYFHPHNMPKWVCFYSFITSYNDYAFTPSKRAKVDHQKISLLLSLVISLVCYHVSTVQLFLSAQSLITFFFCSSATAPRLTNSEISAYATIFFSYHLGSRIPTLGTRIPFKLILNKNYC